MLHFSRLAKQSADVVQYEIKRSLDSHSRPIGFRAPIGMKIEGLALHLVHKFNVKTCVSPFLRKVGIFQSYCHGSKTHTDNDVINVVGKLLGELEPSYMASNQALCFRNINLGAALVVFVRGCHHSL